MLSGPAHVGKSTLARYFAQSLICQSSDDRPCGACLACHKLVGSNHPDIRIFDEENQLLKIERIRDLQQELILSPYESPYRVALLCNFERATTAAANALLKTLEEPPPHVILILTATDPGRLLSTIVSRCQGLTLRLLPNREVEQSLQARWSIPPEKAELLTRLAAGRPGWAIRAWQDEAFLDRRQEQFHALLELLQMPRAERLLYAHNLSQDEAAVRETLLLWLTIWRDLLLLHTHSAAPLTNLDWRDSLQALAQQFQLSQIKQIVGQLQKALKNLEYNVNSRLNLEVTMLKLPIRER